MPEVACTEIRHGKFSISIISSGLCSCRERALVGQVSQLVLQYLPAQAPQVLPQLDILGLTRRLCDLAVGYNLRQPLVSLRNYQ